MTGKLHIHDMRDICRHVMFLCHFSLFKLSATFGECSSLDEVLTPVALVTVPVVGWWEALLRFAVLFTGLECFSFV